ncbi:Adaptor protein complex beta subunit [Metschnikowia bicuspidata var. bicuspidata NRRL YB-4993]|uniref:AP complex subunit beta n=1 Tax=Metschnikowia bicuspidata var. bicuspidata NRRL YB-4993 TaxID=869754 RepID=A0A1A0HHN4_9ASCO|nr:Adaptor protein complex beta subunit [Metschnikowia bicuspidata var. bicuspidata NRRL YB-4993]OBA23516.1 Adaptor protein complex beta subunit [Metschnikowia bicuspidata var. bicuspidata NRRL YB-4993]
MSLEKKIINFIKGPKKGEAHELRAGLVSQYKLERKDAIERTIQAMTVGKDVLALFPDVLKNIATHDLEQKKLVYLYLMNYAKSNPELCILAVNTFVQDTEDVNPLVRALAIRTMGCIRVDRMVDYMELPLRRTLRDDNPYVRKTAAVCVAKLFDLNAAVCVEHGFVALLKALVHDANPMVVANALSALHEIRGMARGAALGGLAVDPAELAVDAAQARVLVACLNECTEWGRISILGCLADYRAQDAGEALHIVERAVPQLQHANAAVVLAAIKVIVHQLDALDAAQRPAFLRKLAAPMVSLVSQARPEAQYVGLKNIRILLEKYPQVLTRELRVFFLKYSDPLYLKLEKLEVVVRLACDANSALLLGELREYAMEIEPALVARAVACIAAVAIQLPAAVVPAASTLIGLLDLRGGPLLVNETVARLAQVLRRYPRRNDLVSLIVPVVAHHIAQLSDTPALCAYVFLLGEYPGHFSAVPAKLQPLVDGFLAHDPALQLAVLTAVVKIAVASGLPAYAPFLQAVLDKATHDCAAPDVRDKAFIYWRLLSSSPAAVQKAVVASRLPPIKTIISSFNPVVLDALVNELATLSSVYHKPAATFIDPDAYASVRPPPAAAAAAGLDDLAALAKLEIVNNARNENLLDFDDDESPESAPNAPSSALADLNDLFAIPAASPGDPRPAARSSANDIMGLFDLAPPASATKITSGVANLDLASSPGNPAHSGPSSAGGNLLELI